MWSFGDRVAWGVIHVVNYASIELEKSVNTGISRKITHK